MKYFIQSTRPGKEELHFEILEFNPETKQGVIIGSLGRKFTEDLSKETLLKNGYKVVSEEALCI